jgi:hypothetical protein
VLRVGNRDRDEEIVAKIAEKMYGQVKKCMEFCCLVINDGRSDSALPLLQRKQRQDGKRLLIVFDSKTRKCSDTVKKFKMYVTRKLFI